MMVAISDVLEQMLIAQGMSAGSGATDDAKGMDAGERTDAAHPAIGRRREGQAGPMGISGKEPRVNAPAKFTGLHVVVDNSRCMPLRNPTRSAQCGSGIHLVLV